jgi:hypothetical protein
VPKALEDVFGIVVNEEDTAGLVAWLEHKTG